MSIWSAPITAGGWDEADDHRHRYRLGGYRRRSVGGPDVHRRERFDVVSSESRVPSSEKADVLSAEPVAVAVTRRLRPTTRVIGGRSKCSSRCRPTAVKWSARVNGHRAVGDRRDRRMTGTPRRPSRRSTDSH